MKNAVVLMSGGLDSTTVLAIAKRDGFDPYGLSLSYGQRHEVELEAAKRVAEVMGVTRHVIAHIDLRMFGGSALTDDIDVPKDRATEDIQEGIPVTYVPARNTIFLSFALAFAETIEASDIFIGINAVDYSGYPDCRPEYLRAFEEMANLATKVGVESSSRMTIHAPLMSMSKADIITTGLSLGVDYGITISCYDPTLNGEACGRCDACHLRLKGFAAAGVLDPTPYQSA